MDLTKVVQSSSVNTFKNNDAWVGTKIILASHSAGLNIETFPINLGHKPDLLSVQFKSPNGGSPFGSSQPANQWFRIGAVYPTSADYLPYYMSFYINGNNVVLVARAFQQNTGSADDPNITFGYRIVDYSVF